MLGDPDYDKLPQCTNSECPSRLLCELPSGNLPGRDMRDYDERIGGCNNYYPVADLRSEGIRGNSVHNGSFLPRTKNHIPRGHSKRVTRKMGWDLK